MTRKTHDCIWCDAKGVLTSQEHATAVEIQRQMDAIIEEEEEHRRMNVIDWARRYVELGWYPLPLKYGTKDLRDREGLKRLYQPEDFLPTNNIGLQLASARDALRPNKYVAVDFDAPELTPKIVSAFLPHTCGWGRESKPLAQILYRCSVEKTLQVKDLAKGEMILEVRASHQSMCPPSTHPSGERLDWLNDDLTLNELEWKHLQRCVNLIATWVLVVRIYPAPGARHYFGVYLAGFLRHLGVAAEEAIRILELAAEHVGDREFRDRLDAIRSTFDKSDDDPLGGAGKLAEDIDDKTRSEPFIKSLRKISQRHARLRDGCRRATSPEARREHHHRARPPRGRSVL